MKRNALLAFGILAFLALTWGSSFILMKIGLRVFSPTQVAAIRITVAGFVFIPWLIKYRNHILKKDLKWMFAVGVIGNGIPAFLFTNAQLFLSSSLTGALNALTPLFTLLIGILFLGVRTKMLQVVGVLIGLGGALILVLAKSNPSDESRHLAYAALVVLATLCYGTSVNLIKTYLSHYRPIITAAFPLAFAASLGLPVLISSFAVQAVESDQLLLPLLAVLTLGIIGTSLSLIFFNRLIQISDAVFASSVTYLIPVVAMLWGWLDNEYIGAFQVLGLLIILAGIYLANRPKRKVA